MDKIMKNLKLIATSFIAIVVVIIFSSCEKQDDIISIQGISFSIDNLSLNKKSFPENKIQLLHSEA